MARMAMNDFRAMGVAGNGEPVGQLRDLYFDDRTWKVRYLLLATAQMMPGHRVLIPPEMVVPGTLEERSLRLPMTREEAEARPAPADAADLHGVADLVGFPIQATDGEIGQVGDVLIDENDWTVTAIVVETARWWLPGKSVRIPVRAVQAIDWADRRVRVDMKRQELAQSPEVA